MRKKERKGKEQMAYYDLSVTLDREHLGAVSEYAASLSPSGLFIEDYSDVQAILDRSSDYDYIDEDLLNNTGNRSVIHLYPADRTETARMMNALKTLLEKDGITADLSVEEKDDEQWETSWQDRYEHVTAGRFEVLPYWKEPSVDGLIPLRIDTAEAYGSGQSVNTQLCLEALSDIRFEGDSILDMGTGTGILGIAALLSGAGSVIGMDTDPFSIYNSVQNAQANGVCDRFQAVLRTLQEVKRLEQGFDAVFAHITADVIIEDRELYYDLLRKDGLFLGGGIISGRKEEVTAALTETGFEDLRYYEREEWVTLVCRKGRK